MSSKDEYFQNPDFSHSDLCLLEGSPAKLKAYKDGVREDRTNYRDNGEIIHRKVLTPSSFAGYYVVEPSDAAGGMLCDFIKEDVRLSLEFPDKAPTDRQQEAYASSGFKLGLETVLKKTSAIPIQNYYQFLIRNFNKMFISADQLSLAQRCYESVLGNIEAASLLYADTEGVSLDGKTVYLEEPVFWNESDLALKSKPDRIIIDSIDKKVSIIDVKSTSGNAFGS